MANWDITTAGAAFEFETTLMSWPTRPIAVDTNHFFVAYLGAGSDGFVSTFAVNTTTWAVTESGTLEHDTQNGSFNSAVQIDTNHFAVFYLGSAATTDGWVQTFEVNTTTWAVTTSAARFLFDTDVGSYNSAVMIDANHIINFWSGVGNDGFAQVFTVNTTTWAVTTAAAQLEFDVVIGQYHSAHAIDDNHFINFYAGNGSDGFVEVFTVNTTTWAVTTAATRLEFDTQLSTFNSSFKVDTNHFINFWGDTSGDGIVQVFTVNTTTWAVTTASALLEFDTQDRLTNTQYSVSQIDSTHFIHVWAGPDTAAGTAYDGFAQIFAVNTTTWAVTTAGAPFEFDTTQGEYNAISALIAGYTNKFLHLFSGSGDDGFAQVLSVEIPNYPPTVALNSPAAASVDTYYFDVSDGGPTDPDAVWTNDANAFDGNTGTSATIATAGTTSSNYLLGEGTDAPSSGGNITSVRARINGVVTSNNLNGAIYTDGLGELLGTPFCATGPGGGWGSYTTLSTPSGGWTWAKLQALEVKLYIDDSSSETVTRVEIEVTSIPIVSDTTPTLDFTGTDTEADDIRYNIQIATDSAFSAGAVVKNAVNSARSSGGDPTVSVTVTDENALIAVVTTQDSNTNNLGAGSVIRDGQNFTKIAEYGGSGGTGQPVNVQIWQLINPNTGTSNAVADCNGAINECTMTVYELKGCDTSDLVNTYNGGSANGSIPTATVTTDADSCYLIGGFVSESTISGVGGGQDSDSSLTDQSYENTRTTSKTGGVAGSNSLTVSGSSNPYAYMIVAINKGAGSVITDKVSGTDAGFANPDVGGDTDPFTSGDNIQFTVQAGDALAADTYYWKVRGIDPSGSNTYGDWSSTRSFIVESGSSDLSVNVSDSITVSESVTRVLESFIDKSDSITLTEFIDRVLISDISISDSITITESTTSELNSFINVNESITVTESVSLLIPELYVSASDSITISESVTTELNSFVSTSDSITISENLNITIPQDFTVSDEITVSESTKAELNSFVSVSDSITLTESVSLLIPDLYVSVSESITLSENIDKLLTSFVNVSEEINVTENTNIDLPSALSVSDEITLSESVNAELNSFISVSENITLTEDISLLIPNVSDIYIDVSDSITISESVTTELNSFTSVSESITVSENLNVTILQEVAVSDEITLSESVRAELNSFVGVTENITITENISLLIPDLCVSVSESITLTENIERQLESYVNTSDEITISESVNRLLTSEISTSDSITISENFEKELSISINVSDSITLTENTVVYQAVEEVTTVIVSDEVTISENIKIEIENYVLVSDSISTTDTPIIDNSQLGNIQTSETVQITENTVVFTDILYINVSENISVSDVSNVAHVLQVKGITDSITVSENTVMNPPHFPEPNKKIIFVDGRLAFLIVDSEGIPHYMFI